MCPRERPAATRDRNAHSLWHSSRGGASWPSPVYGDTKIIPTAALSERYDTNVYFAPPELLAPGTRLSDFVTSLGGGVQLLHKSRDVEAGLTGGVNLNAYVYNPDLNFVGTSADAYAKLDGWVSRLAEGAKLQVSDRFQYTPEPPSFITARQAPADDAFSRGVQGFRANTFSNTVVRQRLVPGVQRTIPAGQLFVLIVQSGFNFRADIQLAPNFLIPMSIAGRWGRGIGLPGQIVSPFFFSKAL